MYIKCSFSNFVMNGTPCTTPVDLIFCKYWQHSFHPFEKDEVLRLNQFMNQNEHNFKQIEILSEAPLFDLYDPIRDINTLPTAIPLDFQSLMLKSKDNHEIPVQRFDFFPVGLRRFV